MKLNVFIRHALVCAAFLATSGARAADLVWIGGSSDWNVAGNWSPVQVPTAADNAFITNNGTYTVTLPAGSTGTAGSVTVGGASGTQTLAIDRATLTVNGASAINANGHLDFLTSQSILTGAGNLTVNGTLNWANGTMSGTGTTTIGSSGVLAIGSSGVTFGRTLNNSGTGTWSGGNLSLSAGVALNNLSGGVFDITADGRLSGGATTPLNNSGLFRQTAGTAGTIVTVPFNNSGTLAVLAQTLNLNLGGTHTGTMNLSPGATLNFGGGSHVLAAGSLVTGTGILSVSGNATTLSASGTFDAGSTLSATAGTTTLASSCHLTTATLNISGANSIVNFNSSGTVAVLNLTGGTLGGTTPVTVTGPLTLGGGTITSALVTANGGLSINGGVTLNGGKLVNPGQAIWSAGNFTGANGAVFSNLLGATFINSFDGNAPSGAGATPIFVNAGTFAKTNGTAALGATSIDFQFINTGTVEVQTNTLRYGINQQTAGLTLLDGGNLSAQAQPIQLLGGSLVGTGLVTVANVQNVINSAVISPGFPLGELDIAGNYQQTASGALNIELGGNLPGTNFDLVTVTAGGAGGVATLGGTLNVTLTNGFSPAKGATFTFLTANSRAGAFATFNYPSNDIGMQVSYDPTSAKVTVSNLKPIVANPIVSPAAATYGAAFNFQFAATTFTDPDGDPLTYTATGMPPGITFTGATRTFSGTPTQAGIFSVTLSANDGGTPGLTATNAFTITVSPAILTIAAQPQSKSYGGTDPALTFATSGLQFSDTQAAVLTGALARAPGETVAGGPYTVTQGTLTPNGNYIINFTGNTLTITKAALSVTADAKTKAYGVVDPAFTVTYAGFINSETPTVLGGTLTFTRAPGENVGSYLITPSGQTSGNYTITLNTGTLSITRAVLSVTADPITKTYGAIDPALTYGVTGLKFSDTAASVLTGVLTRVGGETVAGGPYTITQGTLTPNGNYTISFTGNIFAITGAPLSVTADAKTKTYGAADPAFTVTYTGFVNGETSALLGGALAFTRAPGENAGSYLITPGGLTSGNYAVTFTTNALTITPRALTITASGKAKTYGSTLILNGAADFTSAGLQNSETIGSVTLTASGSPAATAATAATGSYTIAPSAATGGTFNAANYTITYATGTLTVNKAALSVTADARTKTFGAADPAFTATYAGFANSETPSVLGGTLAFSRVPGESVGSYLITPSGLTGGNYTITFNPGTLTITAPAPLMLPLTFVNTTNVVITWGAVSNAIYRVQFNSALGSTNWTDMTGDVTATSSTASRTDIRTGTSRFYRVRVLP